MKTKLKFRSVVFKRAYILVKQTGCNFSEALKEAWNRYRNFKEKTVAELAQRINNFDYCFDYSDDSRVYRKWSEIQSEIREQVTIVPTSFIQAVKCQLKSSANISLFTY